MSHRRAVICTAPGTQPRAPCMDRCCHPSSPPKGHGTCHLPGSPAASGSAFGDITRRQESIPQEHHPEQGEGCARWAPQEAKAAPGEPRGTEGEEAQTAASHSKRPPRPRSGQHREGLQQPGAAGRAPPGRGSPGRANPHPQGCPEP